MKQALSDKAIAGALKRSSGSVRHAAWDLGVSPRLIRQRIDASYELQEVADDVWEGLKELAFVSLAKVTIESKDIRYLLRFLARFAPERGYGRRRPKFEVLKTPEERVALEELSHWVAEVQGTRRAGANQTASTPMKSSAETIG